MAKAMKSKQLRARFEMLDGALKGGAQAGTVEPIAAKVILGDDRIFGESA